ncbi:unnamed protein product [Prorocentrum cordatum]|uniref:Uncharacterized protein n=1 Tax=Prorocentrum cordatum TaxID=2364126 RepID=A0ABN9TLU2_9DINO|nr:unnamed protein product [Polarella glacialis]
MAGGLGGEASGSGEGTYTVFDCCLGGAPFEARTLHEAVHSWADALHEHAALANGGGGLRAGLALVQRTGTAEVLPWGFHAAAALRAAAQRLQAWAAAGELESGGAAGASGAGDGEGCLLEALGGVRQRLLAHAQAHPGEPGARHVRVEVWSLRAEVRAPLLRHRASGVAGGQPGAPAISVALVSLGGGGGAPCCEVAPSDLEVIQVAPSSADVRRHFRRLLSGWMAAVVVMPAAKAGVASWRPARAACVCLPTVLPLPDREESAPIAPVEFNLVGLVSADAVAPCHSYGVPLVLRPAHAPGARASLEALAAGLQLRGAVGIFSAELCPAGLCYRSQAQFFFASPSGCRGGPRSLVLQGALSYSVASAAVPVSLPRPDLREEEERFSAPYLALGRWPLERVYNPLRHCLEPPLCRVLAEEADLRGRARDGAKIGPADV